MTSMDHRFEATARGGLHGLVVHPAFPAIVGTWFAALGGFGWMMLPAVIVDGVAGALQLGAISANFVPPVGFVGRASLAVVVAALAGGCGWVLAHRVASRRSDEWGEEWQAFDIEALAGEPPIDGESPEQPEEPARPTRKRRWGLTAAEDEGPVPWQETLANAAPMRADPRRFDVPPSPTVGVDSELPVRSEPMDRHPISESADSRDSSQWDSTNDEAAADTPETPLAFAAPSLAKRTGEGSRFLADIEKAELGSLGTVQLAERLAISIARRRERTALMARQAAQPVAPMTFEPLPAAASEEVRDATCPTGFDNAPEALRPISFDLASDDAEVDDLGLSLPLGEIRDTSDSPLAVRAPRIAQAEGREEGAPEDAAPLPTIDFDDEDPEQDEAEGAEDAYGSLLATRRDLDLSGKFVRIEEPELPDDDLAPVVTFPSSYYPAEQSWDPPEQVWDQSEAVEGEPQPAPSFIGFQSVRRFDPPPEPADMEAVPHSPQPGSMDETDRPQSDQVETGRSLRHALEALRRSNQAG